MPEQFAPGRTKAWLTPSDRVRINELLNEIVELLTDRPTDPSEERELCSPTWVLAPLETQPVRRHEGAGRA